MSLILKQAGPITERQALEISKELWLWLADNPQKGKVEWPGWARYGQMWNNCPCCQSAGELKGQESTYPIPNCRACPLRNYWPQESNGEPNCCHEDSPFQIWDETPDYEDSDDDTREKCANEIVKYCEDALYDLDTLPAPSAPSQSAQHPAPKPDEGAEISTDK